MTRTRGRSALVVAPAAVPLALALVLVAVGHPTLRHRNGFRIVAPVDGTTVGPGAVLAWTADPGAPGYAVVVDVAPPAPGHLVRSGTHVMVAVGRALALTLGPARSGSPSARDVHRLTVVPVDSAGRRRGEDVATVRVKAHP